MEQQSTVKIRFPVDGVTVDAKVSPAGRLRLRLLEQPLLVEGVTNFDVIEVKQRDVDTVEFLRVIEKSGWRSWQFLLAREQAHSGVLDPVLRRIEELHGRWERVFGGYLVISLPPESNYDPTPEIVGHGA